MHCKRCGKAIGTDRGICPFCGAMFSSEQMEIYKKDKKASLQRAELLTEKYGNQRVYYEPNKSNENKLIVLFITLGIAVILAILVLIIVININHR